VVKNGRKRREVHKIIMDRIKVRRSILPESFKLLHLNFSDSDEGSDEENMNTDDEKEEDEYMDTGDEEIEEEKNEEYQERYMDTDDDEEDKTKNVTNKNLLELLNKN